MTAIAVAHLSTSDFCILTSYFRIVDFLFCDTHAMDYTPQRVVSLQPSATVILRDLGRLSSLVACTKYCLDVCPEIDRARVAIVADSWTAQATQISELKPELVIASVPYQEKALAEIMKCGARFLGLAPKSLADVYGDVAVIAGIMGERVAGSRVIRKMQDEISATEARTRDLPRPRVFCEEWGKPLIASQRWVAELVEAAGGEFIGTPGVRTSFDEVAAANPDVIIAAWCGAGDRVPLEKIIRERKWDSTPAAWGGRVYCIRDEYLNTPAPTLVCGLHALAAAIHPERFPQADGLRWISK
jgi:iron complex transport system substrate-binding protein